jgi:hypothetical protein
MGGGKSMQNILRLVVIICFLIAEAAFAEMPVEVISTTPDTVGQRLVFAMKEGIRTSASLGISFDQTKPRMQVNVVTLDQNSPNPGYSSAYSVVVLWNNPEQVFPFYLTQYVGYCGSSRVRECADGLVANVSEKADEIIKLLQVATKTKR